MQILSKPGTTKSGGGKMKIVYDGKKLKKFYDQRAFYFHHLSTYLISCMFLYTKFPERNEDPFPPTGESFKELINWFFS